MGSDMVVFFDPAIDCGLGLVGIMQTTSPPKMFIPRAARTSSTASSMEKPVSPGSMLETVGATAGSRQSRSKMI